jgi:hypothetical protein
MEEKYIEKKIKDQLINKDFKLWDKESIDFLLSIFEYEKYNMFYNINLMLLDDYIKWYSKNNHENSNNYSVPNLKYIYCLINEDIYHNVHYNYIKTLNNLDNKNNTFDIFGIFGIFGINCLQNLFNYIITLLGDSNFCSITFGIIATIIYIFLNYITSLFKFEKKEEKRHIFELKIPIPDNLINNSLIKLFLGDKFNIN